MQSTIDLSSIKCWDSLYNYPEQTCILVMDPEGFILDINKAFQNSFNYKRENFIGQNFSQLFTEKDRLDGLPERELKKVLSKGQAFDNNYLVTADHRLIWVSGESILTADKNDSPCIVKLITDIQDQKDSEVSIDRLNNLNSIILDSIRDVVLVLDDQLTIMQANNAFFKLFPETDTKNPGYFPDLLRYNGHDEAQLEKLIEILRTGENFNNTKITIKSADQDEKVFDLGGSPISHLEQSNLMLVAMHDISMHLKMEREREDIIGFVAHELRNPLANISLCNEIMARMIEDNDTTEIMSFLIRSRNNILRLNKMVGELYDATKVNSGNFKLEFAEFNFSGMLREAIHTIEVLQPSYTIIIRDDHPELTVRADRYRMMQVIGNFLSNGIKYSSGKTNIYIKVESTDESVTVSVRDEGLGISASQLTRIFDRYYRLEKTSNLEGIGLGLFLSSRIIEAHKGNIWAESEEGKGATFYFSIPVNSGGGNTNETIDNNA